MRMIISKEEKRRIGKMIRWLRMEAKLTQQQFVDKSNMISLRSLSSLEQGNPLKDDEIYDHLLEVFDLHINYQEEVDYLDPMYDELLHAYEYYDDIKVNELCIKYQKVLRKYASCVSEFFIIQVLDIFKSMWTKQNVLTNHQFCFLYSIHDFLDARLQYLVEDALYAYEYNIEHIDTKLEEMFQKFQYMKKNKITRFSIGVVLHLSDKHQDYLNAFIILLKREKIDQKNKNEIALFSIYHWMSILSVRIYPDEFPNYLKKAFYFMNQIAISKHMKYIFYYNVANCYHVLNDYKKAMEYYYESLKCENKSNMLPQFIWMCDNQYQIDKTLPKINFEKDVSDCSEKLQICWQYFVMQEKGASAYALEEYIMKQMLPYLEKLAFELKIVYKNQLCDLIKTTRNYKNLLIYMEKLNL